MKIYKKGKSDEVIIFLHPFPYDQRIWKPQIEFLSKNYSCISYNILERFELSKKISKVVTIDSFVEDFLRIIEKIKYRKLYIVCLSIGGYILLRALEKNLSLADKLIFIGTRSESDTDEVKLKRLEAIKQIQENKLEIFLGNFIMNTISENTNQDFKFKYLKKMSKGRSNLSSQIALQAVMGRRDTTNILQRIKVPTLILCGDEDTITPVSSMQTFANNIPNSIFKVVPNAAHICNFENSKFVNLEILKFLQNTGK